MIKRITPILLVLLVAGCNKSAPPTQTNRASMQGPGNTAGSPPAQTKGTIGVSVLTMSNPFFKIMGDTMIAEGKKLGFEVTVIGGENDPAKQRDQVKDFITKKVAAIILCPCDSKAVGTAIQEANKAGIPVFTADIACLDKAAKVVSHIATDNHAGGKLAGQAVVDALGGKGKVAVIDYPEVESVIQRTTGFHEVVDKVKGIKVVATLPGNGDRDQSFKTAQDILEQHQDLDAIFAINDPSAMGAIAALEKTGRLSKVKVIGFDGMPEAKQAVKEGKIYADIVQYPDQIGQMAVQSVARYLAGETMPAEQLIPTGAYKKADADKDATLK